jgi:hypothetical protein
MESIFLSQHFEETDRDLVEAVQTLIDSYGLLVLHGDALGGGAVSPGVVKRIQRADALVAIATPIAPGSAATHPWVVGEMTMARTLAKPTIALVHTSVVLSGPFSENERIAYDPARPLPALKKLAATIGGWRKDSGRPLKALVLPDTVAALLAKNASKAECRYRYYDARGKAGDWYEASVVPYAGGPVLFIDNAPEDLLVEVRLKIGPQTWTSKAVTPYPHVKLVKENGR